MMYNLIAGALLVSFLLAVRSMAKERGTGEIEDLSKEFRKSKIKGTIVIDKNKKSKHYSSYS